MERRTNLMNAKMNLIAKASATLPPPASLFKNAAPGQTPQTSASHLLQLALKEAEAIAWQTGVPELVFHALAEEKLQGVQAWCARQEQVRRQSRQMAEQWSFAE